MALTRKEKEAILEKYVALFSQSQALILADYRGLRVSELGNMRRQLRESGNGFLVVKNTLAQLALQRAGMAAPDDLFAGPVAIAICNTDIASVAKTMNQVAQETKILTLKGAILGGKAAGADQARALADLPSREVLLAKAIGTMQAPITGLVNVLAGPMRGLVTVLNARASQMTS